MKEERIECLKTLYVVSPNSLASMAWTLLIRADVFSFMWTHGCVYTDESTSAQMQGRVHVDMPVSCRESLPQENTRFLAATGPGSIWATVVGFKLKKLIFNRVHT